MATETLTENSILHNLASEVEQAGHKVLSAIRDESMLALNRNTFPTRKDEAWRFTDLRAITRNEFVLPDNAGTKEITNASDYFLPEAENSRLVFINGKYDASLSSVSDLSEGVTVGNLSDHLDHPSVSSFLNNLQNYEDDVFVPFNGLFFEDGAFIYLKKNAESKAPIHLLNLYTDSDKAFIATPRILAVIEEGARATIVEDHIGVGNNLYMTIPVSEFKLRESAHIHHARTIRDNINAVHMSRPIAYVEKNAEYHSYTITLGAKLSRNEPRVIQEAQEVDFTLDGLVLIDGEQIADTHSLMDHRFSFAKSHQLHKVVVNGSAHSIFNGKIFVRRDAQKIDSFQENRNLLLSRDGLVNTIPQLEIFADDVLCSHGATIGQLDPEEVFYLQSRGMTEEKAKEVLTYAYALETIENIEVESVHKLLIEEVKRYTKANSKAKVKA